VDLVPPYLEGSKELEEAGGNIKRATQHDVLATYGPLVKNPANENVEGASPAPTRLLFNSGLTPDEAAGLIQEGKIDAAVFGILWITNPDFYKRIEQGKQLNYDVDFFGLYNYKNHPSEGYSDYPTAT
jgi:2,4-dienoyl-CoA reductase-like NADH-dependent reductase (Old Yellow Enzyme family)